jgi:hypothetical protein
MPLITEIHPEVLRDRHRLSPGQINMLLGGEVLSENYEDKIASVTQVAEFIRITDALAGENVKYIPLKGPLLSYKLYGDPTLRTSHDIDILVSPFFIEQSIRLLEAAGYLQLPPGWPDEASQKQKRIRYSHHISLHNPDGPYLVELHWRLVNRQWFRFEDIDNILQENTTTFEYAGRRFSVLNPEFELLYLVVHGGLHRWGRLKWLEDVQQYLKCVPFDKSRFTALAERLQAGRLIRLCNTMMSEYYVTGLELPCHSKVTGYMIRTARRAIANEAYKGPVTIGEILRGLRYSMDAYHGLGYKAKLTATIVYNSLFAGRLSRIGT